MRRFISFSSTSKAGLTHTNASPARVCCLPSAIAVGFPRFAFLLIASVVLVGWLCVSASQPADELQPYTETITNTVVKFDMVPVPGGSYEFADPAKEGAKSTLELKAFWIAKTEVTWDAYDAYSYSLDQVKDQPKEGADAISRPSRPYGDPTFGFGHDGYAVIGTTHYASEEYCKWLSWLTGKKYRLPTEAEWEYACRAGTLPAGPIADAEQLEKLAWHKGNADYKTHPVAKKDPNAWGLYDMLGNVGEWCTGPDGRKVIRGGHWEQPAENCHPGAFEEDDEDWDMSDPQFPRGKWWASDAPFIGFRVVCEQ